MQRRVKQREIERATVPLAYMSLCVLFCWKCKCVLAACFESLRAREYTV